MGKKLTETEKESLARLRESIAQVDKDLLDHLRRRMDLAAEIGRIKADHGLPVVIKEAEDRVLDRARRHAEDCGVSDEVMNEIFHAILSGSVERQHRVGVATRTRTGGRVLIVGGGGSMGGWFASFLRLVGYRVGSIDPIWADSKRRGPERFGSLEEVASLDAYNFVLVACPLARTPEVLAGILARRPRKAVIVEISSIKSPLKKVLARARGARILSLHPMFGPGKSPYEPLRFVLAVRDDPSAEHRTIMKLLQHPYTSVFPVPFEEHDRLMGWVLGLAHLTGIVFGSALTRADIEPWQLTACASTTFSRQASTALSILSEDPALYLDIQRLNPHRREVYAAARKALEEIVRLVEAADLDGFRATLDSARRSLVGI